MNRVLLVVRVMIGVANSLVTVGLVAGTVLTARLEFQ